ncbi:hypothetical protein [Streptomyces sp. NPDC020965]|uniref:hypothetical protein n=1 Tax=Streptomyces sp. NPDC020965 TaxID=3365105 RepID=UPI0037A7E06D
MSFDYPAPGELPVRSVLAWPPCRCGNAICPDGPRTESPQDDSPVLQDLRERVREVNEEHEHWRGLS